LAVTTIDPRCSVFAALESRLTASRPQARAAGAAASPRSYRVAPAAAFLLARRIGAIARADPDRRRKAVRVFLEAEFARAFGAGLLNDPGFPRLLDAVQQQMQEDAQAAAAVHALGELLLRQAA
jgi:hypothetical protein